MLVPYRDPFYQSRRPTLAVPAGQVLQIGRDSAGNELGLHPRLTGLRTIFNEGRLALIQRTGYENSSRSHFEGTDIWSTANPLSTQGPGWLGRYLDTIPAPVDPLHAWNTGAEVPHSLLSRLVAVPSISNPAAYAFQSPNGAAEAAYEREAAMRMSSHLPMHRPHLAFVNATRAVGVRDARSRRDRRAPMFQPSRIRRTDSRWRCARSPARWPRKSARAFSGCRRAATIRTRRRAAHTPR